MLDSGETAIGYSDPLAIGKTTRWSNHTEPAVMTRTHSWSAQEHVPALTVESAVAAIRPPLLECGGKQRLYLICRDKLEQEKYESQLPSSDELSVTTILARSSIPMLVHEAQGIQLKNVLSWLDSLTGGDGQISRRLATRCDIDWD